MFLCVANNLHIAVMCFVFLKGKLLLINVLKLCDEKTLEF